MATDYLTLGPTPCDEPCEQLGGNYNPTRAKQEMKAYKHQLERMFPNADIRIKSFPHDFGTYSEVCAVYNTDDEQAANNAFEIESGCPANWDAEAIKELKECGYLS